MTSRAGAWSNPAHVEMVGTLWPQGVSATEIANRLNTEFSDAGYSRSAIIGKAHRMGFVCGAPAPKAPSNKGPRPKPPVVKPARLPPSAPRLMVAGNGAVFEAAEPRPPRVVIDFKPETPGIATVLTIRAFECRWPIGDPAQPGFTFCGAGCGQGPYCSDHARIAYQPADARKRSAAELARGLRRYI